MKKIKETRKGGEPRALLLFLSKHEAGTKVLAS